MATTSIGTAAEISQFRGLYAFPSETRSKVSVIEWELTGTYAAGGFSYSTASTGDPSPGIRDVQSIEFPYGGFSNGTVTYTPRWDYDNDKVELFTGTNTTGNIEAAAGTDFASFKGLVKVTGF